MSGEVTEGLMLVIGPAVFIIPGGDLSTFRAPDDVATMAREQLEQQPDVSTDGPATAMVGVRWSPGDNVLEFSSLYEHHITISRRWC